MAGEIQAIHDTGSTCYAIIRDTTGQVWSTVGSSFGAYATGSLGDYDIAMTEQGTASGYYTGTFPGAISAGVYNVVVYDRAGGSPAESDDKVAHGSIEWTGSAVDSRATGVDVSAISGDSTAADNLETMLDGTGGQTFSLGRLEITGSGSDAAVEIDGNSRRAVHIKNNTSTYPAVYVDNDAGAGIIVESNGTADAVRYVASGSSGAGFEIYSTGSDAMYLNAAGSGQSALRLNSSDNYGIESSGGWSITANTGHHGVHFAGATDKYGMYVQGSGTGGGLWAQTGSGIGGAAIFVDCDSSIGAGIEIDTVNGAGIDTSGVTGDEISALITLGLDHLVSTSVAGADVADDSIIAQIVSKSATADWDSFDNTTDALEAIADTGGASAADIADAVWDEATAGHTTAGTFGEQCKTDIDAILVDTSTTLNDKIDTIDGIVDDILVDTGTTLDGKIDTIDTNVDTLITNVPDVISLANINAQVDTALTDIGLDHLFSAAIVGADVTDNSFAAYVTSKSATADFDSYDNETDSLEAIGDLTTSTAIGDAVWDEVTEGSTTARQMLRILHSAMAGKCAITDNGNGTFTIQYRDIADSKDRIDALTDNIGRRTTVNIDGT